MPLQGDLQIGIIPRALPWAKSFCPFRACCLLALPWAKSFCPFRAYCLLAMPWDKSFWAFSPYFKTISSTSVRTINPESVRTQSYHKKLARLY